MITYTYDILDRVTSEITPNGGVQYEYDILGRRTAMSATGQEKEEIKGQVSTYDRFMRYSLWHVHYE